MYFSTGAAALLVQPNLVIVKAKCTRSNYRTSSVWKSSFNNSVTEIFNHAVCWFYKIQNDTPYIAIDNLRFTTKRKSGGSKYIQFWWKPYEKQPQFYHLEKIVVTINGITIIGKTTRRSLHLCNMLRQTAKAIRFKGYSLIVCGFQWEFVKKLKTMLFKATTFIEW
jgi:hypothetical protein